MSGWCGLRSLCLPERRRPPGDGHLLPHASIAQAAQDLEYFRLTANTSETGQIRVLTHVGASVGKPGISIAAEKDGVRYHSVTNAAGDALFTNLAPGAYTIHDEMHGDFP